jgi:hypothetical protein
MAFPAKEVPTMKRNVVHYLSGYLVNESLVQSDWDYPGIAEDLGWHRTRVQVGPHREVRELARRSRVGCQHAHTDGTVDCPCGVTASDFIRAAGRYLDSLAV